MSLLHLPISSYTFQVDFLVFFLWLQKDKLNQFDRFQLHSFTGIVRQFKQYFLYIFPIVTWLSCGLCSFKQYSYSMSLNNHPSHLNNLLHDQIYYSVINWCWFWWAFIGYHFFLWFPHKHMFVPFSIEVQNMLGLTPSLHFPNSYCCN